MHNVSNMCILFVVLYCWCSSRVHGSHVGLSLRYTLAATLTDASAFPSTIWCCGVCTDCLTEYRRIQTNKNKLPKAKRMNTKLATVVTEPKKTIVSVDWRLAHTSPTSSTRFLTGPTRPMDMKRHSLQIHILYFIIGQSE